MKTIPLYDREPFAKEFSARVISCQEEITGEKKLYKVVLDQTMFFPEQGGQSSDKGTLDSAAVLDVQIEDEVIYHYCSSGFFSRITKYTFRINRSVFTIAQLLCNLKTISQTAFSHQKYRVNSQQFFIAGILFKGFF